MNAQIKQLLEYKQRALNKTNNPATFKAIEFEMHKLKLINEEFEKLEMECSRLLHYSRNLEEAKSIAEMVCIIHGLTPEVIRDYYRRGMEGTIKTLEDLTEENLIEIPEGLRKYIKK